MKRTIFMVLMALSLSIISLTGCSSQSSTSDTTVSLVFPDRGNIKITGYGYFNFSRLDNIADEMEFKGVVFSPHREKPGVASTGPIMYKIDVEFENGTVELLQYIGLGYENNIDINLTRYDYPKAGIMLAWHNVDGGLTPVMYLLVGE
ncbi:MAG: hypothetical protein JW762_01675 [Dehalococcoidales bacterium]|nr:hypothetical protein [Dehalococcoidales bacterium]